MPGPSGASPRFHTIRDRGCGLVRQGLICAEQEADAGAFAQLREQCVGGIQVSGAGIGCVGPDCFIDNLRRFFRIHVEGGFQTIGLLTHLAVAAMADRGRFGGSAVLVGENAAERGRRVDLNVGSERV